MPSLGAVLTGLLLAASFPPLEWGELAWFALVPLMIAASRRRPFEAMKLGFLSGAVFWGFSISWVRHVTIVGWITLALYCALYLAPFAMIVSWWIRRWGTKGPVRNIGLMAACALTWAGLEYVRSTLFTGFPWNGLGVSQYQNLTVIQLASWGGVYAVSALMVWINTAVAVTILGYVETRGRWGRRIHAELVVGLLVWACAQAQGWRAFGNEGGAAETVRVALVQPNIPQVEKWDADHVRTIYERLKSLTELALQVGDLDLIIWPETAVPDDVRYSEPSYSLVFDLAARGVPLLIGSMDAMWEEGGEPVYYNSSFLFGPDGGIVETYDKQHLVVFGEYVPFRKALPFMKAMTPIEESFSAGSTGTVFRLEQPEVPFSSLICFEDTVSRLARAAVRNGARLLVNQTNDAWFDVSSGSRQHMSHCVFRCIENRVPAFRATNTGVSCAIDRHGRIYDVLSDPDGHTLVAGFKISSAAVPPVDMRLTFYTRHGDVFAWIGVLVAVALVGRVVTEEKGWRSRKEARAEQSA